MLVEPFNSESADFKREANAATAEVSRVIELISNGRIEECRWSKQKNIDFIFFWGGGGEGRGGVRLKISLCLTPPPLHYFSFYCIFTFLTPTYP